MLFWTFLLDRIPLFTMQNFIFYWGTLLLQKSSFCFENLVHSFSKSFFTLQWLFGKVLSYIDLPEWCLVFDHLVEFWSQDSKHHNRKGRAGSLGNDDFVGRMMKRIYDLIDKCLKVLSLKTLIICCQNKDMTYTKIAYRKWWQDTR